MALEPDNGPLERATRALQDDRPDGWIELSESIMSRVRKIVTPAAPILTVTAGGRTTRDDHGSRTFISSRVVRAALRESLRDPSYEPSSIDLSVVDGRLTQVSVELVCAYGSDLPAVGETVRRMVSTDLARLTGSDGDLHVAVRVVDVVVGDPHLD